MGRTRHSSLSGLNSVWLGLLAVPLFGAIAHAGIVNIPAQDASPAAFSQVPAPAGESAVGPELVLPDPATPDASLVSNPTPDLSSPQFSTENTAASAPLKDTNAIPLPPAVQSGLTGLVALGLAGGLRRLRRAFR
jgi:hypothetical protein